MFLTYCCSPCYHSALTVAPGCIVSKLCISSCSYSKLALLLVWYAALLLWTVLPCWIMSLLPLRSVPLDYSCNWKRNWVPSGLGQTSERLQRYLSPCKCTLSIFLEKSEGLLQVYLLVPQREHCSKRLNLSFEFLVGHARSGLFPVVSCVCISWHASSLPLVRQRVWFIVGTHDRLPIGSVLRTHTFAFDVRARPVCDFFGIIHVRPNLWLFKVVLTPPLSVSGDTQCFKL